MIQIPGLTYIGQISNAYINNSQPIPLYEPAAPKDRPSINTMEGWNALAYEQNRLSFISCFGREPVCDTELRAWMDCNFPSNFRWEGNM